MDTQKIDTPVSETWLSLAIARREAEILGEVTSNSRFNSFI